MPTTKNRNRSGLILQFKALEGKGQAICAILNRYRINRFVDETSDRAFVSQNQ